MVALLLMGLFQNLQRVFNKREFYKLPGEAFTEFVHLRVISKKQQKSKVMAYKVIMLAFYLRFGHDSIGQTGPKASLFIAVSVKIPCL